MDLVTAVGLAVNVATLIQVTLQIVQYINDVGNAPKDRATLAREATSLLVLFTNLRYQLENIETLNDPWFRGIRSIGFQNGPLQIFKEEMEKLAAKLKTQRGLKRYGRMLTWPLHARDVTDALARIERMKTLIGLALQHDSSALLLALKGLAEQTAGSVDQVTHALDEIQTQSYDTERRDIIAWLSPISFVAQQVDIFSKWQQGTGNWFLETADFRNWIDGRGSSILWCSGLPGAGKTVLVSVVITYLQQQFTIDCDIGVGYIYCSYKAHGSQTSANLIGSLLQQIVQRTRMTLSSEIMAYYEEFSDVGKGPTLSQICHLLETETRRLNHVFIVIDALDECEETTRETLILCLSKLSPKIRLLITSRHMPMVNDEAALQGLNYLEIQASDMDIRKYLEQRLTERRMSRHIRNDPELKETIVRTIVGKAQGMFLLAQLQMDSLARKRTKSDVREAVPRLPESLDETYNEAIERIRQQDEGEVRLANKILLWVTHSLRPLKVKELLYALATVPGNTRLDEEALPYEDDLLAVCAGLIYIERESGTIGLVHYTTQEYFRRFGQILFPTAHEEITIVCVDYMKAIADDHFWAGLSMSDDRDNDEAGRYDFLRYAARFWAQHAVAATNSDLHSMIVDFIHQKSSFYLLMKELTAELGMFEGISEPTGAVYITSFDKKHYPLLIACHFGLDDIARFIMHRVDLQTTFAASITPLHLAACNGHEGIVSLLLARGFSADAGGSSGIRQVERPLALAVRKGHVDVVKLLLQGGARLDAVGEGVWCSILELAILYQQDAVVQMLLERGVDIETTDYWDRTALCYAASLGHHNIIQLLLDHGASTEATDNSGMTALHKAAENGLLAATQGLLQGGANVAARDAGHSTPLHYAASAGMVRLLMSSGAKVNVTNSICDTPLHEAARARREDAMLALLDNGANYLAENVENDTALTLLDGSDLENVVRALLERGADEGDQGSGRTPLHWAVIYTEMRLQRRFAALSEDERRTRATIKHLYRSEHEKLIMKELQNGCNIDSHDRRGGATPLHLAIRRWMMLPGVERQSALVLLNKGANPNLQDASGNTPLHLSAAGGHVRAARLLLKRGASADVRNDAGKTPLRVATDQRKASSSKRCFSRSVPPSVTSGYDSSEDDEDRVQIIQLLETHTRNKRITVQSNSSARITFPSTGNGESIDGGPQSSQHES